MRSDPTSVDVVEEPEQDETGFRDDEEEAVDEDEEDEEDEDSADSADEMLMRVESFRLNRRG